RLEKVEVNEVEIADVLPSVYRKLDWLDKEDLIKRLVSLEFSRLIEYYQDNEDIETIEEKASKKQEESKGGKSQHISTEEGFSKIYIGMGKIDGLLPKNLLELLNANVEGRVEVGRIDLFRRYTLFDVDEKSAKKVLKALRSLRYLGRDVRVEFASEEQIMRAQREKEEGSGGKLRAKRGRSREGAPRYDAAAAERPFAKTADRSSAKYPDRAAKRSDRGIDKSAAAKPKYKESFKDKKKAKAKSAKGKY
ncbi:MAG: DbpA RNA binding domain-containing protein, partial [Bacteroidales bacterium]|nr:DbpA RNA binding domain-containing protein [Bacteroidales bacterium]